MRLLLATQIHQISKIEDFAQFTEQNSHLLLDVRSKSDFELGHLPDAVHLDILKSNIQDFMRDFSKETHILVYCNSGSRSKSAIRLLSMSGFLHLYSLNKELYQWLGENLVA